MKSIHNAEVAEKHGTHLAKNKVIVVEDGPLPETKAAKAPEPQPSTNKAASSFPSAVNPPVKVAVAKTPTKVTPQATPALRNASTETIASAPAKSRVGKAPLVTSIRHWSTNVYTRVAIDLDTEVQYEAARVPNPDRIFFDLHGVKLSPELIGRSVEVTDDGYLKRIRAAQFSNDVTRIVLDVSDVSDYSAFLLPNPYRLIIDIHGRKPGSPAPAVNLADATPGKDSSIAPAVKTPPTTGAVKTPPVTTTVSQRPQPQAPAATAPAQRQGSAASMTATAVPSLTPAPNVSTQKGATSLEEVASLSHQKNRVKATTHPTTAPISASVAGTSPAPDQRADASTSTSPAADSKAKKRSKANASSATLDSDALANGTREAVPTSAGQRSWCVHWV